MEEHAENHIEFLRRTIEEQYLTIGRVSGFGELLCYEMHHGNGGPDGEGGLTFIWLAEKWGISVSMLGKLIKDHCDRLEEVPVVNHDYIAGENTQGHRYQSEKNALKDAYLNEKAAHQG